MWLEKLGRHETPGEGSRDRGCACIGGKIARLWVMTEIWKTGNVQSQGRMFDTGQDSEASEKACKMEEVRGESRIGF